MHALVTSFNCRLPVTRDVQDVTSKLLNTNKDRVLLISKTLDCRYDNKRGQPSLMEQILEQVTSHSRSRMVTVASSTSDDQARNKYYKLWR